MGTEVQNLLTVGRALPIAQVEDQKAQSRGDKYGNQWVYGPTITTHPLADDGSYFSTTNATPGTPLLYSITTAFADTTPFLYIFNNESASNQAAPDICIEQIKIMVNVVPASTTSVNYAMILDTAGRNFTTDNTASLAAAVPNYGVSPRWTAPVIKAQNSLTASVIAASSPSKRIIGRGSIGGLPILGDELAIVFGHAGAGASPGSATASRRVSAAPAFEIAPGSSLTLHLWLVANAATGLSYEIEVSGWIR